MRRLPRKLSSLLRAAVTDAQTLQKDPRYTLNMGMYHQAASKTCYVCMAGAVMARRLECAPNETVIPDRQRLGKWESRLLAIDAMRKGHFEYAARQLRMDPTLAQREAMVEAEKAVDYASVLADPFQNGLRAPWERYMAAAEILERAGL